MCHRTLQLQLIRENRQAGLNEKIIWQEDKEPIFKKQLNSDKVQKPLEAAKAKLEYDVDGALSDFVECLISASQCMVKKCHMNKHTKGAAWFDTECREAKRESKGKLRKFRKTRKPEGIYPSDWAKAIIVPIHKKGDIHLADNYRGVSLLSIVSKCYTSILNTRLYNWLEENDKIVEMQAGFRRNYSTTDQIFNLYAIAQKCLNKKGQKLYVAFVDFKKAFDSVHHDKLLQAMQKEGVQGKFFASIKSMYDSLLSCVRANGEYSDFFDCPVGVRQGCVLSPTIFSLFINQLANYITETGRHGIQLLSGLVELFILLFADDVALLATTPYGLQNQLNSLKACCDRLHMEVNRDKTKVMVFRKGGYLSKHEKWYYDGIEMEVVNKYHYLGFAFTTTLSVKQGTDHLVAKDKKAVFSLCTSFQKMQRNDKRGFL